jgi:predicted metalloprotease with PDZ domain
MLRMIFTLGLVLVSISTMTVSAKTNSAPRVHYNIKIESPHSHYAKVTLRIEDVKPGAMDIYMPIWTPGSYLAREFAKNVESVNAIGLTADESKMVFVEKPINLGKTVEFTKTNKNTWRIMVPKGLQSVEFTYSVYCFELSVRTSFIDDDQALLNMASVLMTVRGSEHLGGDLSIDHPVRWFNYATALDDDGESNKYVLDYPDYEWLRETKETIRKAFTYSNFDDLVDAPVQLGNFDQFTFDVDGIPHEVALVGVNNANQDKLAKDMQLMCTTMKNIIKEHPCKRYTFIVQNVENGGGGLEHKNSTVLMMSRWAYTDASRYKGFLGLVAHEYFHLWNVKRIRPIELGPFKYGEENYTSMLWLAEGITSYYDELALLRAGIVSHKEFLGSMAGYINAHENRMGARVATITEMSHDAWIKEYRPHENSKNSTYSYYSKGVIVGFLFDAWISANTGGSMHLDDVMHYLWRNFYANKALGPEGAGITEKDFITAVKTIVSGSGVANKLPISFDDLAKQLLHSTEIPDYKGIFLSLGIETKVVQTDALKFGLTCELVGGKTIVKGIHAHPMAAGFRLKVNVNDELLVLNGFRVDNNIDELYIKMGAPKEVSLVVSRGGITRTLNGEFTKFPEVKYEMAMPEASKSADFWLQSDGLQTLLKQASVK